jgi:hypothetical protein
MWLWKLGIKPEIADSRGFDKSTGERPNVQA